MTEYYTKKDQVKLSADEKLGFTPGRGYYAIAAPAKTSTASAKSSSSEELGGLSVSQAEQVTESYGVATMTGSDEGSGTSSSSSSTTSTSTPPTKHATQPSKAPTVAAKTPSAAEAAAKSVITDAYRPVVFKASTKAKPNSALLEAAHRQAGTVAHPVAAAKTTKPATTNTKKSTTKATKPPAATTIRQTPPRSNAPPAAARSHTSKTQPLKSLVSSKPADHTPRIQASAAKTVRELASSGDSRKQAVTRSLAQLKKPGKIPLIPVPVPVFPIPGLQFPNPLPTVKKTASRISNAMRAGIPRNYQTAGDIQTAAGQRDLVQAVRSPEVDVRPSESALRSNVLPRSVRSTREVFAEGGDDARGASDGEPGGDLGGGAGEGGGEGHELED